MMVIQEGGDQHFVQKLTGIIEDNIDDPGFSTEQICRAIGLSRSQLHRRLKAATDLSLSHFIRQVKLRKSRELLSDTDLTVAEVAYQCGISSPQNFTKYFTTEFGITPSEYRKQKELLSNNDRESEGEPVTPDIDAEQVTAPPQQTPSVDAETAFSGVRKWSILLMVAGLAVVTVFVSGVFTMKESVAYVASPKIPSVAVIPFKNYYTPDNDFLCEGVVEDVLTHLTKFENMRVISRTSTERYRETKLSIRQIAAELGVKYVLEGSIRQSGGKVRITAQLIEAAEDRHIWARNYDRPKENIMEIQSEVALDIAQALNQEISPDMQQTITELPTLNAEAYQALLRGRHRLRTRKKEDLTASMQDFEQALRLDPHFSDAYVGMAAAYFMLRDSYFDAETSGYLQEAENYALRAIREDHNNAKAFAFLGLIYQAQYQWEKAITVFETALALNPSDALINYWFGNVYRATGQIDLALHYQGMAYQLDPFYPVIHAGYSLTSILAGRYDLADRLLEEGERKFPDTFLQAHIMGTGLLLRGRYEAALPYLERGLDLNPKFKSVKVNQVYCRGKMGQRTEVEAYLATLDLRQPNDCVRAAVAYLSLEEPEKGIAMLRRAADFRRIDTDILIDPRYLPVLYHPDVLHILQEFALASYLPIRQ